VRAPNTGPTGRMCRATSGGAPWCRRRWGRNRGGTAAAREEKGKTGRPHQESGGGESSPRGKAMARVETSRVRGLPNSGTILARVKFNVDFLAREMGRTPPESWEEPSGILGSQRGPN
jgi:hypothetical protein